MKSVEVVLCLPKDRKLEDAVKKRSIKRKVALGLKYKLDKVRENVDTTYSR